MRGYSTNSSLLWQPTLTPFFYDGFLIFNDTEVWGLPPLAKGCSHHAELIVFLMAVLTQSKLWFYEQFNLFMDNGNEIQETK